jgi:hypothetical protein
LVGIKLNWLTNSAVSRLVAATSHSTKHVLHDLKTLCDIWTLLEQKRLLRACNRTSPLTTERTGPMPTLTSTQMALPVGLYCDGIQIGQKPRKDTLYAVYITFLHLGTKKKTELGKKHLWTMYRNSQLGHNSTNQIWDVLLWELQALQHGCKPQAGELGGPGEPLAPGLPQQLHVCLMQVRGDWAWYCEALAAWQWNSKAHMCHELICDALLC